MKSYKDITNQLSYFANQHLQLKHYLSGIPDDESKIFDTFKKMYPVMWVQPVDFNIEYGKVIYNLNIHIFSLDHESKDNAPDVMSDMIFIANDLYNFLYKNDLISEESVNMLPMFYDRVESISGVTMNVAIEVNRENNTCNIPIE